MSVEGIALLLLWQCTGASDDAGETARGVLETIVQSWSSREQRIRSAVFEWEESVLRTKHSGSFRRLDGEVVLYPPGDVRHRRRCVFKLAGRKMRYEYWGPAFVFELGGYAPRRHISTNDGEVTVSLFDNDCPGSGQFYPTCVVSAESVAPNSRSIELRPFLLWCRPFTIRQGEDYDVAQYDVAPFRPSLRGRVCIVLRNVVVGGRMENVLWVDSERGFVPLRWQSSVEGGLRVQLDVDYTQDVTYGPVPSWWKYTVYERPRGDSGPGRVTDQTVANLKSYELNVKLPVETFRVDLDQLSPGTLVHDLRNHEQYIVRMGGGRRVISDDEARDGFDYQRFLTTESDMGAQSGEWPLVLP
ncbi:MAG TPA: hypothetical protein EYH34_13255, partial [Planctomycetes bacterium]|nr:hypothetical protein [Planctomycetota bacterium]